jgi:hypothetical protein
MILALQIEEATIAAGRSYATLCNLQAQRRIMLQDLEDTRAGIDLTKTAMSRDGWAEELQELLQKLEDREPEEVRMLNAIDAAITAAYRELNERRYSLDTLREEFANAGMMVSA